MKYLFSQAKLTSQFFYKKIDFGEIDVYTNLFHIKILPYLSFSGYYYKEAVIFQNNEKIIHRTLFSPVLDKKINLENICDFNEFFIEIFKDGSKIAIYQSTKDQLVLKT